MKRHWPQQGNESVTIVPSMMMKVMTMPHTSAAAAIIQTPMAATSALTTSLTDRPACSCTISPMHTSTSQSSSGDAEAMHILHWLQILEEGPTKFECMITRNWCHPLEPIALFTIVCRNSTIIKVTRGFNMIIVLDKHHRANGWVGFFLGDHIAAPTKHGWHLQNPPLCTMHN